MKIDNLIKARPQTAHQRNFSEVHPDIIHEKKPNQRPMSGRSGLKGKHRRLKSAAVSRTKRYETSQSVKDFVSAAADPRSGMWAMKSYKTPVVFNPEGYKIKGMSLKEPVPEAKSQDPKIKFHRGPLTWSKEN